MAESGRWQVDQRRAHRAARGAGRRDRPRGGGRPGHRPVPGRSRHPRRVRRGRSRPAAGWTSSPARPACAASSMSAGPARSWSSAAGSIRRRSAGHGRWASGGSSCPAWPARTCAISSPRRRASGPACRRLRHSPCSSSTGRSGARSRARSRACSNGWSGARSGSSPTRRCSSSIRRSTRPVVPADWVRIRHGELAGREGRWRGPAGRRRFPAGVQLEAGSVELDDGSIVVVADRRTSSGSADGGPRHARFGYPPPMPVVPSAADVAPARQIVCPSPEATRALAAALAAVGPGGRPHRPARRPRRGQDAVRQGLRGRAWA